MSRISIFGMGYVGCVSAACLSREGHDIIGIDISPVKLDALRAGHSPVQEPGLEELLAAAVVSGRLSVQQDVVRAILKLIRSRKSRTGNRLPGPPKRSP